MLTEMEEKTLRCITEYIVKNGKSPSQIDIAVKLGISRQRASVLIKQISKKGEIKYRKYEPRSIQIKH